jgi:hypothetical protein
MRLGISQNARPQATTLLIASAVSLVLYFVPYVSALTYPFQIFVTFIHEGGHAIATVLTGNSVASLSVAADGSGLTYHSGGGVLSQMFISSAGYLGAMGFGALLLVLIRHRVKARVILIGSAAIIVGLTLIFGIFKPILTLSYLSAMPFTVLAGVVIAAGLIAIAKFATPQVASFFVGLLAVQCVLNALLNLRDVFFLSTPFAPTVHNDAINMANATGIPAIFWTIFWIAIAFGMLWFVMRLYVVSRDANTQPDLPFEDSPAV